MLGTLPDKPRIDEATLYLVPQDKVRLCLGIPVGIHVHDIIVGTRAERLSSDVGHPECRREEKRGPGEKGAREEEGKRREGVWRRASRKP